MQEFLKETSYYAVIQYIISLEESERLPKNIVDAITRSVYAIAAQTRAKTLGFPPESLNYTREELVRLAKEKK